jgi:predicted  nucleic acid-binding Zn-ribbon protein
MNRALLELQEVDNTLTNLKREKAHLDDGTQARAKRDELEKAVAAATQESHKILGERTARELELQTAETKIALQQKRMMNASSAHEISALERDIAALGRARGDLDEAILELMDKGETVAAQLEALQKQLKAAKAQVESVESSFALDSARLDRSLAAARTRRDEAAAQLSPAELEKFEAFAKKFHGVAVAKVVKGNCSACGAAILPFTLREAKSQDFPTCEGCSRLIFVE